jgi:excisionase family DNA binding protein
MPTVTLELAQRANALALEVIERRAPQTPPPSSVDERITTALTDAARPLPFSELRGMCHVRTASLYERLAALMAAGRLVKSDHGYRLNDTLSAAARHHHQSRRRTVVTSASRMLYGASEAVVGSPAPPHRAPLIPSFCSIGTIPPSRPARRQCRRAQRRSRMARLRATASAARSVLDGREHDGMLGRVGTRSARTPIGPLKSARATPSKSVLTLICNDANVNHGRRTKCIAFGNMRIDAAVSAEVLSLIAPLGFDAALQAIADRERAGTERLRQNELALEQARYEAARAHRQYDAVDPENRLVAGDLERRWNERLGEAARLEDEFRVARDKQPPAVTEAERAELLALGTDLPRLWNHSAGSAATRKRILRAVLEEIIVTVEPGQLRLKLHWKGGDHTALEVVKNRRGQHRWKTDTATEQLICDLARLLPDSNIASVLNRLGVRTAKAHTWTQQRVRTFRNDHAVAVYRDGERAERGEVILHEAASRLGVSKMTVIRLIKDGMLPAKQICIGAPYVIREADLALPAVKRAIKNGRAVSPDARQGTFEYQ